MTDYKAPIADINFIMDDLLDFEGHYQKLGFEDATPEMNKAIIEEAAKFSTGVLAPLYQSGDSQGCQWEDGVVTTPDGFKEAYQQFVEAGWPSLSHSVELGGQGMPDSFYNIVKEIFDTANFSWGMYPGLSHGAITTIKHYGTDEQKAAFLPKMVSGEWTGTMCLTEAHCGTDLGLLRTKAEPNGDGTYNISGSKIFISAGEHDMTDNIVHIVLARLPDAPAGTKGISLFIVPKHLPDANGEAGERNGVSCGSIEHKMGIKASATCVINFDAAKATLIGPANKGLNCMFTFMGEMRIATAQQGVDHAELGFQKSLAYAKDRLQMRGAGPRKDPSAAADPIIVHPDVRRMLLTQKAFAEGGRMMIAYCSQMLDVCVSDKVTDAERKKADDMLAFLTPIAKGFLTEVGSESANLAMQCFGGHGFIKEWGVEQNVRDCRIASIYEGTTGIQGLDLLGRKVLGSKGALLNVFTQEVREFISAQTNKEIKDQAIAGLTSALSAQLDDLDKLTAELAERAANDANEVGAASVDYLHYAGYVTLAYLWARAAAVSSDKLASNDCVNPEFYKAKIQTAQFFFERLLPRTKGLYATAVSGADNLMAMDVEAFSF